MKGDFGFRISDFEFKGKTAVLLNPKSEIRNPKF